MYKAEESEQIWIRKAKRGDAEAFARLYETICQDLYRFALYMMKHPQDAEDMVSEAVTAAYGHIAELKKDEAFRRWMFRILGNCCRKKLTADGREARIFGNAEAEKHMDAAAPETDLAQRQDLKDAFAGLPDLERLIVSLTIFGGYSSQEVGDMLSMNPSTVRSRRSRALKKLKESLERGVCCEPERV